MEYKGPQLYSGKLEDCIKNIDRKIESYLALLNESEKDNTNEFGLSEEDVLPILQNLSERKEAYEELKQQIDETDVRKILCQSSAKNMMIQICI